jgi:hypothetical protein
MRTFKEEEQQNPSSPQEEAERQKQLAAILKRGRVQFCERTGRVQMPTHMFQGEKYDQDNQAGALNAVPNHPEYEGAFEDAAEIAALHGVGAGVVRQTRMKVNRKAWEERMSREDWAQRLEEARANGAQEKLTEMGVTVPKVSAIGKCLGEVDRCEKIKLEAQLRRLANSRDPKDIETLEKTLAWADYLNLSESRPPTPAKKEAEDNLERLRNIERRRKCRKDYLEKERNGEMRPRVREASGYDPNRDRY